MKKLPWSCVSCALACLLVAACGDDETTDATTAASGAASGGNGATGGGGATSTSSSAGGSGTGGDALSFEDDVWPILTMPRSPAFSGSNDSCSGTNGCHLNGAGGLLMPDPATALANLLDTPSTSVLCAGLLRVVASAPDQSCFVVFYEQRLRDQLGWVELAETDLVRSWVAQGAAP